jgi:hypothetical protein
MFGRTWKTLRDKEKILWAVFKLRVLQNMAEIVDVFKSFFNGETIDIIVKETNR